MSETKTKVVWLSLSLSAEKDSSGRLVISRIFENGDEPGCAVDISFSLSEIQGLYKYVEDNFVTVVKE